MGSGSFFLIGGGQNKIVTPLIGIISIKGIHHVHHHAEGVLGTRLELGGVDVIDKMHQGGTRRESRVISVVPHGARSRCEDKAGHVRSRRVVGEYAFHVANGVVLEAHAAEVYFLIDDDVQIDGVAIADGLHVHVPVFFLFFFLVGGGQNKIVTPPIGIISIKGIHHVHHHGKGVFGTLGELGGVDVIDKMHQGGTRRESRVISVVPHGARSRCEDKAGHVRSRRVVGEYAFHVANGVVLEAHAAEVYFLIDDDVQIDGVAIADGLHVHVPVFFSVCRHGKPAEDRQDHCKRYKRRQYFPCCLHD